MMTLTIECPRCGAAVPDRSNHKLCPKCLLAAGLEEVGSHVTETEAYSHEDSDFGWTRADLEARFPQLEIIGLIGRGGMGAVYQARQKSLDRLVALKVLPRRASRDPSFAERFVREARTMARLNHPHVVTVYEFGEVDELYFFMMEFVDGANLRSLMNEGGLRSTEALSIVSQVCDALQYAHEMGIVHRDIKPENVLIDQRGQVKIADFGLAKILSKPLTDVTLTGVHQIVGTPQYMAPEQMEKPTEVDHRADIYSLGVVFYELLTGELPLGRFPLPSERAGVDADLDDVVLRTLAKEPSLRFQSATEVKTACGAIGQGTAKAGEDANGHAARGAEGQDAAAKDSSKHKNQQHTRPLSLAIKLPSQLEGIWDYVGLLKLEGDNLVLQYRGQEGITGSSFTGTKHHDMPLAKIDDIEMKFGIGGPTLYVTPNDLLVANKIPGMEQGKILIKFARADRAKAEALVRACGERSNVEVRIPDRLTELEAVRTVRAPAIAIILLALINIMVALGGSAAIWMNATFEHFNWAMISGALATALQVFTIVAAIHMYFASNRSLAFAAAICSMIPASPAAAVGIGFGIWAIIVLNREEVVALFESREPGAERPAVFAYQDPSDGKPVTTEALRYDAAARLRIPVAALRLCGWFSLLGLLATLGGFAFLSQQTELPAEYYTRGYLLVGLLATGAAQIFARTDMSRASLVALCVMAVLPISAAWPVSICFGVWSLLVLYDPQVRELHEDDGALPYAAPSAMMQVAALIVLSVAVPLVLSLWWRNAAAEAVPESLQWRLVDAAGDPLNSAEAEGVLVRVNQRIESARLDVEVQLQDGQPVVQWESTPSDEALELLQLLGRPGRMEVALIRDADPDAQGAVDPQTPADMLLYTAAGEPTLSGLRLAVVRDTRWLMTISSFDDIDLADPYSSQSRLDLELDEHAAEELQRKLQATLDARDDDSKPLQLALILDDKVIATSRTKLNDDYPLEELKFTGALPWRSERQVKAMLEHGILDGRLELE